MISNFKQIFVTLFLCINFSTLLTPSISKTNLHEIDPCSIDRDNYFDEWLKDINDEQLKDLFESLTETWAERSDLLLDEEDEKDEKFNKCCDEIETLIKQIKERQKFLKNQESLQATNSKEKTNGKVQQKKKITMFLQ